MNNYKNNLFAPLLTLFSDDTNFVAVPSKVIVTEDLIPIATESGDLITTES